MFLFVVHHPHHRLWFLSISSIWCIHLGAWDKVLYNILPKGVYLQTLQVGKGKGMPKRRRRRLDCICFIFTIALDGKPIPPPNGPMAPICYVIYVSMYLGIFFCILPYVRGKECIGRIFTCSCTLFRDVWIFLDVICCVMLFYG